MQRHFQDFTTLHVDGDYKGFYLLMNELSKSSLGIDTADSQAVLFKDPLIFKNQIQPNSSNFLNQKFPKFYREDRSHVLMDLRDFILTSSEEEFALQCKKLH